MIKEKLRKLRALKATPAIVSRAQRDMPVYEEVKGWDGKMHKQIKSLHRYGFYLRTQCLQGIVKIAAFTPWMIQQGERYPAFEIFLNVEGEEYISRYFDSDGNEKWSSATIENLCGSLNTKDTERIVGKYECGIYWSYLYSSDRKAWINPEGSKSLKRELKTGADAFAAIQNFQNQCKKSKRDKKDAEIFKPWDEDLKLVPKLPKRFVDWAFKNNTEHYIFYTAGAKKGYCSRCGKEVPISGQRHRKEGKCPACKSKILYIANGRKGKNFRTPIGYSKIIQPIEGGYAVQTIQTYRTYYDADIYKPTLRMDVLYKTIVQGESERTYTEGFYKQRVYRWIPCWPGFACSGRTYKGNAGKIKEMFPHSAAHLILEKELAIPFDIYVSKEKKYPVLESLMKIGLYEIVRDVMGSHYTPESFEHREAAKALELDNARLKRLIALGGSVSAWEWLKLEKRQNTEYKAEMIRFFADRDILEYQLQFIYPLMSFEKIWHYLEKQEALTGEKARQLLITWRDYLNMAEKNKVNIDLEQNYKPANIKKAHASMIELANREEIAKEAKPIRKKFKNVEKNLAELKKYEYSADGYMIAAPKKIEDIILEGRVLGHCIHRCDFYFERINTKESFILFLRKSTSPGTPWYTLEVEPGGNIRQKRTTGDNQNPDLDAAMPFLKKWQRHVKKIMSKEDKKLADIADKKRKANYKDIRANKKLVWHGKHQGELLADVLEADFMAAM